MGGPALVMGAALALCRRHRKTSRRAVNIRMLSARGVGDLIFLQAVGGVCEMVEGEQEGRKDYTRGGRVRPKKPQSRAIRIFVTPQSRNGTRAA